KVFLVITRLCLENVEIIHRNFSSCYFDRLSTLLSGNVTYVRVSGVSAMSTLLQSGRKNTTHASVYLLKHFSRINLFTLRKHLLIVNIIINFVINCNISYYICFMFILASNVIHFREIDHRNYQLYALSQVYVRSPASSPI
ncbi:hypothetical protein ALC62_14633, partial [Cyphomyrmex costatus]